MQTYDESLLNDCCQAFAASYDVSNLPAMREVEKSVLGCDYGGTSWTTLAQAEDIVGQLGLGPGKHLLDVGAGSGWPGVFLADTSGCEVTLVDLPVNALALARSRAVRDGIDDRVCAVAGSGASLPFAAGTFSAISHSDVLCCLPEKIEMLDECRRVATDDARMLFSVISVAPGLAGAERQRAIDSGPPFVDAPGDYADLLADRGWRVLEHIDCTPDHRQSLGKLVTAFETNETLTDTLGAEAVGQAREHRLSQIAIIDEGLLVREILLAAASS